MKTKYTAAIAATVMGLGLVTTGTQAQTPINVTVNGDVVNFSGQQPVEQYGSVLVPLRGVFEKLGATVAYDGGTKTILANRGATNVSLQLGSSTARVNNAPRQLSVPAQAVNGTTLVPLRFVSEALGANVQWRADSRTVVVNSGGSGPINPNPVPPVAGNPPRNNSRYTYGRIVFNWDSNGIAVRDRAALETRIRRELNSDTGSRFVTRRENSPGTLDVNVAFRRVANNDVRADVRLGLNPNGRGGAAVTASDSVTVSSRDNEVRGQEIIQAVRNARRELASDVNELVRNNR